MERISAELNITPQGTFYLPAHPRDANRLRRILQRAVEVRGPVPEVTLLPSQVPTAAALSQVPPSQGGTVLERSLSQAEPPEEAKPRLTGEGTEEKRGCEADNLVCS